MATAGVSSVSSPRMYSSIVVFYKYTISKTPFLCLYCTYAQDFYSIAVGGQAGKMKRKGRRFVKIFYCISEHNFSYLKQPILLFFTSMSSISNAERKSVQHSHSQQVMQKCKIFPFHRFSERGPISLHLTPDCNAFDAQTECV